MRLSRKEVPVTPDRAKAGYPYFIGILDYLLHRTDNQWRVINAIAKGVSDLALKRADYSNSLKNKSFEALIAKLNEKIAE